MQQENSSLVRRIGFEFTEVSAEGDIPRAGNGIDADQLAGLEFRLLALNPGRRLRTRDYGRAQHDDGDDSVGENSLHWLRPFRLGVEFLTDH